MTHRSIFEKYFPNGSIGGHVIINYPNKGEVRMTVNYKCIGKRVKEKRRERRMTQALLAEKTDMADSYISRIETGVKRPSLGSLAKIAIVLEVSIDSLVFEDAEARVL
jgi:DNA-binding XRE family transcriptional regulator